MYKLYLFGESDVFALLSFPTGHFNVALLLQFFFLCASKVLYVVFALSFFVPHLSFFWCLGEVVIRDSKISCVPSLIFSTSISILIVAWLS